MLRAALVVFYGVLLQPAVSSGRFEMPFGCEGINVNDQTRQGALNLVNRIRSSVALGEFKAEKFLPSASDMDKMRWDCILEEIADRVVEDCPTNAPQALAQNGMNYYYFGPGTSASSLRNPIESAVVQWVDIKTTRWPADNVFDGRPALRDFVNVIRSTTAAVGCSSRTCGNYTSVACVFSHPNVQVGTLVYTAGSPCKNDDDCTAFSPSFCEFGLCVNAERKPITSLPTTTPREASTTDSTTTSEPITETTTTSMRTATPREMSTNGSTTTREPMTVTTTTAMWTTSPREMPTNGSTTTSMRTTTPREMSRNDSTTTSEPMTETPTTAMRTATPREMSTNGSTTTSEPITKTNTSAIPTTTSRRMTTSRRGPKCPNTAFSDEFRETALALHNDFRSLVATGNARNGEYPDQNAPSSARMNILEYDCLAEQFAHNHVRTCNRRPSSPLSRPGYQENFHILGPVSTNAVGAIRSAVTTWNSELATNGIPSDMVFTLQVSERQEKTVTSVTKIIWGTNQNVGCATQLCEGFYFTSCMYKEPVNVVGQSIYSVGEVCSSCPGGPDSCDPNIGFCYSQMI